jgi:hypothetical protein
MSSLWKVGATMKRIWGVECPECKKRMFSFHVHDFKFCGCPNETMIDGGREYLKYGWGNRKKQPRRIYWSIKRDGVYPYRIGGQHEDRKDRWPY